MAVATRVRVLLLLTLGSLLGCEAQTCPLRCGTDQLALAGVPVRSFTSRCQPARFYAVRVPARATWAVQVEPDPGVTVYVDLFPPSTLDAACPRLPSCPGTASECDIRPPLLNLPVDVVMQTYTVRVATPTTPGAIGYGSFTLLVRERS